MKWFPLGLAKIFVPPASSFRRISSWIGSWTSFTTRSATWNPYPSVFVSIFHFFSWSSPPEWASSSPGGVRKDTNFDDQERGINIHPIHDQKWSKRTFRNPGMIWESHMIRWLSWRQIWSSIGAKSMIYAPYWSFGILERALVSDESGSTDSFSVRSFRFT